MRKIEEKKNKTEIQITQPEIQNRGKSTTKGTALSQQKAI